MASLQIVALNSNSSVIELDITQLKNILTQPNISDRSVVVISIAGAMRKGKSFVLNFFLRYLYNQYDSQNQTKNLLGDDEDKPLMGFSWKHGSERNTTGILIWSDIFIHDYPNGKKIALLLIDTQGMFDHQTELNNCVKIFALSALLSSYQIFNVGHQLQQNDLQYLSLFLAFGKAAMEETSVKPFQSLLFLIRDWQFLSDHKYGIKGGKNYLQTFFQKSSCVELNKICNQIRLCYEDLNCFLMPHPGEEVATNPHFNGSVQDINKHFMTHLMELMPIVLSSNNLVIKKINGVEMKAKHFTDYLEKFFNILNNSQTLPTTKTILSATSEIQNLIAINESVEHFQHLVQKEMSQNHYLNDDDFNEKFEEFQIDSQAVFDQTKKIAGSDKTSEEWQNDFEKKMEKQFNLFMLQNERNRPDATDSIKQLITLITEQKNASEKLNEENSAILMQLIKTMIEKQKETQEVIQRLITQNQQVATTSPSLLDTILEIAKSIIPTAIQQVAKQIFSKKSYKKRGASSNKKK